MEATIVKLGPSDQLVGVCTFEEAFGEHSELRGRGRARRQKRRMKRIADKGERKRARQSIRKEQQEARQERKDTRKTRKVARKAMGDEEDGEEDPNSVDQQDQVQPDSTADQGYSNDDDQSSDDQGSDDETPEPYDFENGESGADGEDSDGEDYAEARGGRRGGRGHGKRGLGSRMRSRRAEHKAAPVEDARESQSEETEGIDGDFMDGESLSAATGQPVKKIHPQIRDTTKRIVWNKEALRRHRGNHARYSQAYAEKMQTPQFRSQPNHPQVSGLREAIQRHAMEIQKHEDRLTALERTLAQNFSGHPHIEHGYKLANIELQKQIEGERSGRAKASINDTIVDKGLGAEIESQRIDVPAQPEMRTIELSSNASGDASKGMSTPTKLLIGAAALGLAYYFAKKYKVI